MRSCVIELAVTFYAHFSLRSKVYTQRYLWFLTASASSFLFSSRRYLPNDPRLFLLTHCVLDRHSWFCMFLLVCLVCNCIVCDVMACMAVIFTLKSLTEQRSARDLPKQHPGKKTRPSLILPPPLQRFFSYLCILDLRSRVYTQRRSFACGKFQQDSTSFFSVYRVFSFVLTLLIGTWASSSLSLLHVFGNAYATIARFLYTFAANLVK